jgi:hypothetical protein
LGPPGETARRRDGETARRRDGETARKTIVEESRSRGVEESRSREYSRELESAKQPIGEPVSLQIEKNAKSAKATRGRSS